jgi:hypothetical protein
VHPAAQKRFLEIWVLQVGGGQMREKVGDDDAFFAGLRRLLPAYDGPAMDLWRGQVHGEALGLSWTEDFPIAREFALFSIANVDDDLPPRENAVVITAQVPSAQIVCAPCLLGYGGDGEYIIDPRNLLVIDKNIYKEDEGFEILIARNANGDTRDEEEGLDEVLAHVRREQQWREQEETERRELGEMEMLYDAWCGGRYSEGTEDDDTPRSKEF